MHDERKVMAMGEDVHIIKIILCLLSFQFMLNLNS